MPIIRPSSTPSASPSSSTVYCPAGDDEYKLVSDCIAVAAVACGCMTTHIAASTTILGVACAYSSIASDMAGTASCAFTQTHRPLHRVAEGDV